ncbi:hypothetical protein DRJ48_00250 [Candidatus Woesearchaeota archaeon]|nr:hypothetical protein [Candidatus Woesearchaeota archaeon]RLE43680.1 MAG: hypothetical protein DRJ48_00250 [Candidatus Woesearchaeota archaeon]
MNKRAQVEQIAEFIAVVTFVLFVIIMLLLFRFSHRSFERTIRASFDESNAQITLLNILRTPVTMDGQELHFGDLLAYYAAQERQTYYDQLYVQIEQNLTSIAEGIGIHNVNLEVVSSGVEVLHIEPTEPDYDCQLKSALLVLPSAIPPSRVYLATTARQGQLIVKLDYCENV